MRLAVRGFAGIVAVLALICATAGVATAQGMYYKEIRKDDRIYVFNNADEAARFEKTFELGRALTRPGAGPNGETVVGDSERALELFFFKYGISEAVTQPPAPPPPPAAWKISGLVFGDYYYFGEHHINTATATQPKWKGQQGVWLRRAYFTYDHNLNAKITTRLRLEMNSNGKLQGGNLTPYVKDAYVRWNYAGKQQVFLGLMPSATFNWLEGFWGLRHIEKTPADLYRVDSSRDLGVSFEGPIGTSGLAYAAQFGNGQGTGAETDPSKSVRVEIRYEAPSGLALEGFYGNFQKPANRDEMVYQVFGGFKGAKARAGVQYLKKQIDSGTAAADTKFDIVSAFAVANVGKKAGVFGRFDHLAGNNNKVAGTGVTGADGIDYLPIDNRFDFNFVVAGVEYFLHPNFRLSPNVEFVKYGDGPAGVSIKDDVVYRATFFWNW